MGRIWRKEHILLLVIILLSLIDIAADYIWGDRDGIIGKGQISKLLFIIQYFCLMLWLILLGKKHQKIVLLQLAFGMVLWFILEIVAYALIHAREMPVEEFTEKLYEEDPLLGFKPKRNAVEHKLEYTTGGDTIYEVSYYTDAYGRRVLPRPDTVDQYALFFGCSFVFGEGVEDQETLPSRFQEVMPSLAVYNYAYSGYGPHHMLHLLQNRDIGPEVKEAEGFGLYVFIKDHLRRAYGNMSRVTSYGWNAPHYALKGGKLVRKGNFSRSRPYFVRRLLQHMDFSYVFHYLGVDWPLRLGPQHYRLVAAIIESAFEEYRRQFGNDNFYVMIFPGEPNTLLSYIEDPRITLLDYSGMYPFGEHVLHPLDTHPNAEAYELISRRLAEDICRSYAGLEGRCE